MHVLRISFMWYLKKNFLEMFSMYEDNKTGKEHHPSSRTRWGIPPHAILEGIMCGKKITLSNLRSSLPHSKAPDDWWKQCQLAHYYSSTQHQKQTKTSQGNKNWASQVPDLGLEVRNTRVSIDANRPEWLASAEDVTPIHVSCVSSFIYVYVCICVNIGHL